MDGTDDDPVSIQKDSTALSLSNDNEIPADNDPDLIVDTYDPDADLQIVNHQIVDASNTLPGIPPALDQAWIDSLMKADDYASTQKRGREDNMSSLEDDDDNYQPETKRTLKDILRDADDGENNAATDRKPAAQSTPDSHKNDVESDSSGSVLNVCDAMTTEELKKVSEGYGLFSVKDAPMC